jgi:hypothetical protein
MIKMITESKKKAFLLNYLREDGQRGTDSGIAVEKI